MSRGWGPGYNVSRLWSLGHRAHFCERGEIFARDEQVIFGEIFIFNSLIFCTWHQWTDNLRTAIIMKGSKSWIASHCINYVCNSFQQFRVWKYCVEISSTITRTCARVRTLDSRVQTLMPATVDFYYLIRHCDRHPVISPPGSRAHFMIDILYLVTNRHSLWRHQLRRNICVFSPSRMIMCDKILQSTQLHSTYHHMVMMVQYLMCMWTGRDV